jgi:uncharacterized protein YlbG (UPF0298 family)
MAVMKNYGCKKHGEKKMLFCTLFFTVHNLDQIPAKITAVMLVKNTRIKHFLRP